MWPSCGTAFLALQRQYDFHEYPQHLSGHTYPCFCVSLTLQAGTWSLSVALPSASPACWWDDEGISLLPQAPIGAIVLESLPSVKPIHA